MDLKRKLAQLTMPGATPKPPSERETVVPEAAREGEGEDVRRPSESGLFTRSDTIASLRAQLDGMRTRTPPSRVRARPLLRRYDEEDAEAALEALTGEPDRTARLPGERIDTPQGPLRRIYVEHDADHQHGSAQVARARAVCGTDVAVLALDPSLAEVDFARALFIDTETTGLAGGAGTLPFLIGMAWFEGERLAVEQLLLERPGLEGPMLARLAERLALASVIVSYNGKSFDWPLLRTRFVLNRIAAPKLAGHLDLLHCARRAFKARLGSMRLLHLEQELFGFERLDDLPGELIPETYLAFLRGRSCGSTLAPIVAHNQRDLVALPALLGELWQRFSGAHPHQDARDRLSFAQVAARAAASERALSHAHGAVAADLRGELSAAAYMLVGTLKLREGDVSAAREAFERAIEASAREHDRARAHLALAKLCEHKTKQYTLALAHAAHTGPAEGEDASARRVVRLQKRLQT